MLSNNGSWRKLEQKTAHSVAQDVRNHPEILHQRFRALELLDAGDELADFDGIDEVSFFWLTLPSFYVRHGRPRILGYVDFDGVEALCVMLKPFAGG